MCHCCQLRLELTCGDHCSKLEIKHGKAGSHVPGLIKERVSTTEEVDKWFTQAKSIRSTASTDMNEYVVAWTVWSCWSGGA
jgi:hypothetical protein